MYTDVEFVRTLSGMTRKDGDGNYLISDDLIEAHIEQASALVDAYISRAYVLPLADTPPVLEQATAQVAIGLLHQNSYGEEAAGVNTGWETKLNWWLRELEKIGNGEVLIIDENGNQLASSGLLDMAGFPNEFSNESEQTSPKFKINDKW